MGILLHWIPSSANAPFPGCPWFLSDRSIPEAKGEQNSAGYSFSNSRSRLVCPRETGISLALLSFIFSM